MQILPLRTGLLKSGDDLAAALTASKELRVGDILVVSSKVVATVEGATMTIGDLKPSDDAKKFSALTNQDPHFVEAILQELARLNGSIVGHCPGALLTEVSPKGLHGSILIANAGLDQSNAGEGSVIGWPVDPAKSTSNLRKVLEKKIGGTIGLIVSDSCCLPRRKGVIAIALTASGFDPLHSEEGTRDLFGRELRLTTEAVADQLATAGNAIMGNGAESTPAAIIRDHGIPFSGFEGWIPGIPKNEDLFGSL